MQGFANAAMQPVNGSAGLQQPGSGRDQTVSLGSMAAGALAAVQPNVIMSLALEPSLQAKEQAAGVDPQLKCWYYVDPAVRRTLPWPSQACCPVTTMTSNACYEVSQAVKSNAATWVKVTLCWTHCKLTVTAGDDTGPLQRCAVSHLDFAPVPGSPVGGRVPAV